VAQCEDHVQHRASPKLDVAAKRFQLLLQANDAASKRKGQKAQHGIMEGRPSE